MRATQPHVARLARLMLLCVLPGLAISARASVSELLTRAEQHHHAGRSTQAVAVLRRVLKVTPAGRAYFELGNCLLAPAKSGGSDADKNTGLTDGVASEAEAAFRAAIAVAGRTGAQEPLGTPLGMTYNNLGNLLASRPGRRAEAMHVLREGLRLEPIAYQYNGLAALVLREPVQGGQAAGAAEGETAGRQEESGGGGGGAEEEEEEEDWFEEGGGGASSPAGAADSGDDPGKPSSEALAEAARLLRAAIAHEKGVGACGASARRGAENHAGEGAGGGAAPPSAAGAPAKSRLCMIVLLDRPGGVDVAVTAAARQTSRDFALVLLDRLHSVRRESVGGLLAAAGELGAAEAQHLPAPARNGAWGMDSVWRAARGACEVGGALEAVALVRQHVWMPSHFVAETLAHHARHSARRDASLLTYPTWLFRVPHGELDHEAKLDAESAAVFTPPLRTGFSNRGWRIARRLQPAPDAPLEGSNASRWGALEPAARALPAGAWSLPAANVADLGALAPASPGFAAERCLEAAPRSRGGAARLARALRPMLASHAVLCEAVDSVGWDPAKLWAHDDELDGTVGCGA